MQGLPVRVRVPYKAWLLAKKLHSHCPAMQSAAMDSAKPSVTKRICQPELGDIHCFQLGRGSVVQKCMPTREVA